MSMTKEAALEGAKSAASPVREVLEELIARTFKDKPAKKPRAKKTASGTGNNPPPSTS